MASPFRILPRLSGATWPPAAVLLAAMLLPGAAAQADTVYKVFDEQGGVTYQAEPPADPGLRFEVLKVESAQRFLEANGKPTEEGAAEDQSAGTPPPAEKGGVILTNPELRQEPSGLPQPPAGSEAPSAPAPAQTPAAPAAPTAPPPPPPPRGGF
jgi:hypothetical protein